MKRSEHITAFAQTIWQWYARHKRTLPWRDLAVADDTQRAYMVLVSEIMLQQTQVPRVIIKFGEFLDRFPTLADLAKASNKDVVLAWQGMGYNSRALRLRDAARSLSRFPAFPLLMEELQKIPGVGHYTAAAIRNFAFNLPTPCLDTNIRRILHRAFVGPERADGTWPRDDAYLLKLAAKVLEAALAADVPGVQVDTANWHAALMDYGSLVCTKRSPKWDICPLTQAGLMKAAYKVPEPKPRAKSTEPGRMVGSTFVPNRIFRGKVVEALRADHTGLTLSEIGEEVCVDWSLPRRARDDIDLREWLQGIVDGLVRDKLLAKKIEGYVLAE